MVGRMNGRIDVKMDGRMAGRINARMDVDMGGEDIVGIVV